MSVIESCAIPLIDFSRSDTTLKPQTVLVTSFVILPGDPHFYPSVARIEVARSQCVVFTKVEPQRPIRFTGLMVEVSVITESTFINLQRRDVREYKGFAKEIGRIKRKLFEDNYQEITCNVITS